MSSACSFTRLIVPFRDGFDPSMSTTYAPATAGGTDCVQATFLSRRVKAFLCTRACLRGFNVTIARRCIGHERIEQLTRSLCHLLYSPIEYFFVCLRRLCKPAQLTNKLQRRGTNFLLRCRRLKVMKRFDISTHAVLLPPLRKTLRDFT